jgi:hypothetical protein
MILLILMILILYWIKFLNGDIRLLGWMVERLLVLLVDVNNDRRRLLDGGSY